MDFSIYDKLPIYKVMVPTGQVLLDSRKSKQYAMSIQLN
jgi:hypothetical protein